MQALQGTVVCQVELHSSEMFPFTPCSRYYTGFSPIFSRYNGENGLVGAINVWECRSKDGLEEYLRGAGTCSRVVPQCQVGFL